MIKQLGQTLLKLVESYFFIIVLALAAGLLVPDKAIWLAPYGTLMLQTIFFLTSLKLDYHKIFELRKAWKMIAAANVFMLLIFPAVIFLITTPLYPSMAVPLLLLAAMPVGMTAPVLVEVVKGRTEIALILTITTSLLAPLTVPLVVNVFASTAVNVSAFELFWSLVSVIVIPFILAQIVRAIAHQKIKATYRAFKPVSLVLLGLLIAGLVARQADVITANLGANLVYQLLTLFIFVAIIFTIGYYVAFWRKCNDRVTVSVSLAIMNFTLAIYLAAEFFADPNVLMAAVLVIFPWSLLLIPYKTIIRKFVCPVK